MIADFISKGTIILVGKNLRALYVHSYKYLELVGSFLISLGLPHCRLLCSSVYQTKTSLILSVTPTALKTASLGRKRIRCVLPLFFVHFIGAITTR